jgi:uncharacterized protein YkwD
MSVDAFTRISVILRATFVLLLMAAPPAECQERLIVIDQNKLFTCPEPPQLEAQMLEAVNRARAEARTCGGERMAAAPPVDWDQKLAAAAATHAADMAEGDFLGHIGPGGEKIGARVEKAGYAWSDLGENVAGGRSRPAEVVTGWLQSPDHCANLMNRRFEETGAACARNPEATYGTYWVLILARQTKNDNDSRESGRKLPFGMSARE